MGVKFGELILHRAKVLMIFEDDDNCFLSKSCLISKLDKDISVIVIKKHKNLELFKTLSIDNTPTFLIYSSGQLIERIEGFISINELTVLIKNKLK